MKQIVELSQEDLRAVLSTHFRETMKWERSKITFVIHTAQQDGPHSSPAFVKARVEREDSDPGLKK